MRTLFLLCGLPFSGKSHAARRLATQHGALIISLDDINTARDLADGGEGSIPVEQWAVTHQLALEQLRIAIQSGTDIVIDDTNCFRFLRNNYRSVAEVAGYRSIVVTMDTPLNVIRERIAANRVVQERSPVSDDILEHLLSVFEWPGPDEDSVQWSNFFDEMIQKVIP